MKRLAYQTSSVAGSNYIQRCMVEYQENSWKQLKSELNMRSAQVNDPYYAFTMLHKERQVKHESIKIYAERLNALINGAFTKALAELQLVGVFIDGLYHDFLHMKAMRENAKHFRLQYGLHWKNKICEI